MGKLFMLAILLLFSVEDMRFQSVPEKWFWGLAGFVLLMLLVPSLWDNPGLCFVLHSDLKNLLVMHTGANIFEGFAKSLLRHFFFSVCSNISSIPWFTAIVNVISRAGFGFLLLYIPYLFTEKKGLGEGDLIYFTLVSCLFPISIIWVSYFLAFFLGCFLVLFLFIFLIPEKKQRNLRLYKIPFIPFLSFGFVIGLFF